MRTRLFIAGALVVGVLAAVSIAEAPAALAAADIGNAGKNIGQTASSWAKWLFGGGVALGAAWFSLPANRKAGPALVFVGFALLLGGFVFSPQLVGDASQSLWQTVLK